VAPLRELARNLFDEFPSPRAGGERQRIGKCRLNDAAQVELGARCWRLHSGRIAQAIVQAWAIYLRSLWGAGN
jgi:hypothetical protein